MTLALPVTVPAEAAVPTSVPGCSLAVRGRRRTGLRGHGCFDVGAIGKQQAGDAPAPHFALVALAAFGDGSAQVRAAQTHAGFGEVQEEDVVRYLDPARVREFLTHLLELAAEDGEGHNEPELGVLAHAGGFPCPPQAVGNDPAEQPAPGPGGACGQLGRLGFGAFCGPPEYPVRCERRVLQPQVVGQGVNDVGGVLTPAGNAEVNFCHGAVSVPGEEGAQRALADGGQRSVSVAAGEYLGLFPGQCADRLRVLPD